MAAEISDIGVKSNGAAPHPAYRCWAKNRLARCHNGEAGMQRAFHERRDLESARNALEFCTCLLSL